VIIVAVLAFFELVYLNLEHVCLKRLRVFIIFYAGPSFSHLSLYLYVDSYVAY
jgi:hypothetical protein